MYKCPSCGAEMNFDAASQVLTCTHCGKTLDPRLTAQDPERIPSDTTSASIHDSGITPEEAMAVHRAASSGEQEYTLARFRYEAYLKKKAQGDKTLPHPSLAKKTFRPTAAVESDVNAESAVATSISTEITSTAEDSPRKAPPAKQPRPTYTARVFSCPNCGAELISADETVATFCSYCCSSVLLESRIQEENCPDYVISFQITREDCERSYRKMLRRALFVPNELKQDAQIERFRGIYMPYWIYSFDKDGSYSVSGSKSRRSGDYVYTKHYRLTSHMTAECKGLSYDASSKFADNLSGAIAPFDMEDHQPFAPGYLSGFYADRGDVHSSVYYSDASDLAGQYVTKEARKDSIYSKYSVSRTSMARAFRPKKSEAELGMFPVWFLGCRSHDGQRISYAVVNGQTGKVAADLPIDLKKYILGSLLLAIPLFFLLNLFLTLTPTKALIAAIVLALVSFFLSNGQLNRIYTRDLRLDDEGLRSVAVSGTVDSNTRRTPRKRSTSQGTNSTLLRILGTMAIIWISVPLMGILLSLGIFGSGFSIMLMMMLWFGLIVVAVVKLVSGSSNSSRSVGKKTVYSAPMKEKWSTLYKPLLAILIALVILIWSPVSDLYYYIGAAAAMICVLWSFLDIIREHNLLTTRKLPQLDKRGGDERA